MCCNYKMKDKNPAIYVEELFYAQRTEWDTISQNYDRLITVIQKEVIFDEFGLQLQYNPERIRSSIAKVDTASILERPCFLCPANLPKEQKAIDYLHNYNILVNPFPIFTKHLTIATKQHTPQRIDGRIKDMLRLAYDLQNYVILYNAPRSGASAPDHFHFQAGVKGMLPIEKDIYTFTGKKIIKKEQHGILYEMEHYLRKTLVYQSNDREWLTNRFQSLIQLLKELIPDRQNDEPMLNLIVLYENEQWSMIVFPREAHRPSLYYEKGERQILFSPGVVDFGGLLIFPRKEDFDKINSKLLDDMFKELTISDHLWKELSKQLTS